MADDTIVMQKSHNVDIKIWRRTENWQCRESSVKSQYSGCLKTQTNPTIGQ